MQIIIHPLSLIPRFWTLHWSLSPMVPSYPVLLFWPYQTWVRYLFDREISHRWLVPKVGTNKFRVKTIEGFRRSSFWGCFFDSHDKVSGLQNCNDASRLGNWFKKVVGHAPLFAEFSGAVWWKCRLTQFQDPLKKRGCDIRQETCSISFVSFWVLWEWEKLPSLAWILAPHSCFCLAFFSEQKPALPIIAYRWYCSKAMLSVFTRSLQQALDKTNVQLIKFSKKLLRIAVARSCK